MFSASGFLAGVSQRVLVLRPALVLDLCSGRLGRSVHSLWAPRASSALGAVVGALRRDLFGLSPQAPSPSEGRGDRGEGLTGVGGVGYFRISALPDTIRVHLGVSQRCPLSVSPAYSDRFADWDLGALVSHRVCESFDLSRPAPAASGVRDTRSRAHRARLGLGHRSTSLPA